MKTINVTLNKKNRKYFAATLSNSYSCKIVINSESENLELGKELTLLVEDVSIRSKYGTQLIYQIKEEVKTDNVVTLTHFEYNSILVEQCKKLGGRWDADTKSWVFSSMVEDEVEELDYIYNSPLVTIELATEDNFPFVCEPASFLGYTLARAYGRDTGATQNDSVAAIKGGFRSGGSMKNWSTVVMEDSIIRMKVPKLLLEKAKSEDWSELKEWDDIKIIKS